MTEPTGLSTAEVTERRARGLTNVTPTGTGRSFVRILSTHLFTVFNAVVGGSFAMLLVLGAWQDAVFGFFVVANTAMGIVQEVRAKRTLARLALLNAPRAVVRRNGADVACEVDEVVLDDLLVLYPGGQVTADAVVVQSRELEVDESLLTGEAVPVSVTTGRELLSGSTVIGGSGLARAIRVGGDSYASRVTAEARAFSLVDSELDRSLRLVIRWISIGLVPVGAIVVNGQMQAAGGWSAALSSGAWRDAAIASIASIIAMVPAGLVFMTSVALAVAAVKLAGRRVLIHQLAAVEVLARVDVLCVDKTGTLTEGALAVDRIELVGDAAPGWQEALAWFANVPGANATAFAIRTAIHPRDAPTAVPEAAVAFSSRHKWTAVQFSEEAPGSWVLGGADVVLPQADPVMAGVLTRAGSIAAAGSRTLVLAHSPCPIGLSSARTPVLPAQLKPVAMVILRERLRGDAAETIAYFAEQGVQVFVLSGDDPRTVAMIARDVGILGDPVGVDARTLPSDPAALARILRTERVFGRVTPEQKKSMVLALRSLGHTVAMTGDGVNDTLALKHADLGIAMGSGSPAARAVANLVLLDGAFARLPGIVAEGRQVIANVERLAKLFLSKTVYAILIAVIFGALLWPFPFLPRQLSVIDGITIGLPGLILAFQPNRRVYRPGFIRRAVRFCVPSGIVVAAAITGVAAYAGAVVGASATDVQTSVVITLALSALWVLVVLARPFTRATASIVVAAYASLLVVLYFPFSWDFLELGRPSSALLMVAVGSAGAACVVLEIVHRRYQPSADRKREARTPPG